MVGYAQKIGVGTINFQITMGVSFKVFASVEAASRLWKARKIELTTYGHVRWRRRRRDGVPGGDNTWYPVFIFASPSILLG